jgi:hypothetical protein
MLMTHAVQPYPAGTRWRFTSRVGGFEHTEELALHWEPNGSTMTDDYLPNEISAHDLWRKWVDKYADTENAAPGRGYVSILWVVTTPSRRRIQEFAPHQDWNGRWRPEDFSNHFTHPVHTQTGERLNWLRLPVLDLEWNTTCGTKGGFVQEVLGWKPAPLQRWMNVDQLAAAAGVYRGSPEGEGQEHLDFE